MLTVDACLQHIMALQGALGASLIDYPSGSTLGATGRVPGIEATDTDAAGMVHATLKMASFATVGQPHGVEEIVIVAGNGYHLLHPVLDGPRGRLVLYVWLDRLTGNLAVTRRCVNGIAAQFCAG
ncbi:MAG TPA: hypothetical protein VF062_22660 [Candidatus Limnocylindrales bacterium]